MGSMKKLLFITLLLTQVAAFSADAPCKPDTPPQQKEETSSPQVVDQDYPAQEPAAPNFETAFMKMIVIVVGILVLIFLCIWLIKRFSRNRITSMNHLRNIKILERRPLSPKTMLYLLEVGGKQVIISESHLEVRKVTSIDWIEK